ncbi:sodium/proton antiporter NhaB [Simiduia curdlanivorans]|uniref:Na(+)/H(+) antiporter NhaB n=1 Tax=Simiduia curdlanivorans TaxID=1492769 RepID=A0ABV8V7V5_9GAMM|nr:sodium/proton antiporter NhaB [Simiduia curdlanivorans]MDN3639692.1 sodium/proton antiporter NhaB [Simiduia curdlanivorans]
MAPSIMHALLKNFLGQAPQWYKTVIICFLSINPIVFFLIDPFVAGWLLIAEFIFTLAMTLRCYPLQPGGLLALEAAIIGMAGPKQIYHEVASNFQVILLLLFMVAGIYFMKNLLLLVFTKIFIGVRSKALLSLLFSFVAAVLSALLGALTVTAVLISVAVGFYGVYHKVASGNSGANHDHGDDNNVVGNQRQDLEQFRAFLRSLMMHGAIGTALGGVCTLIGEPQNLLIAEKTGWDFITFFLKMAPVTMTALAAGLTCCLLVEQFKIFGYGANIPNNVRGILVEYDMQMDANRTNTEKAELIIQSLAAGILVLALAFHVAEAGLVGLMIIVLLTACNGIIDDHQIGHAFEEALPFTSLLIVFFAIGAVIHEQHLFSPIAHWVLSLGPDRQLPMLFIANGALSMISDNVFVTSVYINEAKEALLAGTIDRAHFEKLAIAINTGTNLPSLATPNGQLAFLFLLTSALARLIRLSYGKMVLMALPYALVLGSIGLLMVTYAL